MVGLSVVLEAQKGGSTRKAPQVINKTAGILNNNNKKASSSTKITPSSYSSSSSTSFMNPQYFSFPGPTFLDQCFLCRQKLLPEKDIYMYKGDRGFCSEECRFKQIFMDEEEIIRNDNCSLAAMKPASSSSPSTSSPTARHHHRKGQRNRAGGIAC